MNKKIVQANRRKRRVRSKMQGTAVMPRLSVHRSNKAIYAQLIDDVKGVTLLGLSEKALSTEKATKIEKAKKLGTVLASEAKKKKIMKAVFDRGSYKFHGRIKAVAEGAREGGLEF